MESETQPTDDAPSSVSKPVILIGVLIAAFAAIAIGWVVLNQDDEQPAASGELEEVDLAAPLFRSDGPYELLHAVVAPVEEGENSLTLKVTGSQQEVEAETIPVESMEATIMPLAGEEG